MDFKHFFKLMIGVAVFGAAMFSVGIYTWLKNTGTVEAGVSCFTGKFPALVPVK